MSAADLDALDRGVIAVGQTADEAMSRVVALEAEVAKLACQFRDLCRAEEIIRRAGEPAPPPRPRRRHLKAVR